MRMFSRTMLPCLLLAALSGCIGSGAVRTLPASTDSQSPSAVASAASSAPVATTPDASRVGVGQRLHARAFALGYDIGSSSEVSPSYIADPDREVAIVARSDALARIDDDGVQAWVPSWYYTPEAAAMEAIGPLELTMKRDGALRWDPESGAAARQARAGDTLCGLRSYGDWYGVVAADSGDADTGLGLVWVRQDEVESAAKPYPADGKPEIRCPAEALPALMRAEAHPGLTKARLEQLLGLPDIREASDNVESPGKLKTLEVWRYENEEYALTATWLDDGRLADYRYRDREGRLDFGLYGGPVMSPMPLRIRSRTSAAEAAKEPFAPTEAVNYVWRVRTELPFNYLIGQSDNVLLVAGEDNGFSGMHVASHLYGLDKDTGTRLWKYECGFDSYLGALAEQSFAAVFHQALDSGPAITRYRLRVIDLRDGRTLWEQDREQQGGSDYFRYSASESTVVQSYVHKDGERVTTHLEAMDIRSGKRLWSAETEGEGRLLAQRSDQPAVVLQIGIQTSAAVMEDARLIAYDPRTGKKIWTLENRAAVTDWDGLLAADPRFRAGQPQGYWTRTAKQLILADEMTGKTRLSLPIAFDGGTHYDIINDRYAFAQQSKDGEKLYESRDIASSLIDLHAKGRTLWTVPGRADRGTVEGDTLYYRLDGKPRAASLASGSLIWDAAFTTNGLLRVFEGKIVAEAIPDVYTLDPKTGQALSRLQDVRIGYHEVTPSEQWHGITTVLGGSMLIGSSNGYFGKIASLAPLAH